MRLIRAEKLLAANIDPRATRATSRNANQEEGGSILGSVIDGLFGGNAKSDSEKPQTAAGDAVRQAGFEESQENGDSPGSLNAGSTSQPPLAPAPTTENRPSAARTPEQLRAEILRLQQELAERLKEPEGQ